MANSKEPSAILVWKGNTAWRIGGAANAANPQFKCRWLESLFAAVKRFSGGDMADAFGRAEKVLSEGCGLSSLAPSQGKLAEIGMTRQKWKAAVWSLVLIAQPKDGEETLEGWIRRLKEDLKDYFGSVGADVASVSNGIKLQRASLGAHLSARVSDLALESREAGKGILIEKVHQVKGREFPAVCYFVPKPQANEDGAVASWFSEWEKESARVSYVALTRAQRALMVIIPASWHKELADSDRGIKFVTSFEQVSTLNDYLASIASPSA